MLNPPDSSTSAQDLRTDFTTNSIKLTKRQAEVLRFVADQIKVHSMPPTRAEIAEHFDFKSANAAHAHLLALYNKGAIELPLAISRGVKITPNGFEALGFSDCPCCGSRMEVSS